MKNKNRKNFNLYTQGQRWAVRVLLIVGLVSSSERVLAEAMLPRVLTLFAAGASFLNPCGSLQVLNSENTLRSIMDDGKHCKRALETLSNKLLITPEDAYKYNDEYKIDESFDFDNATTNSLTVLHKIENFTAHFSINNDSCQSLKIEILYAGDKLLSDYGNIIRDFCNECDCPSTILLQPYINNTPLEGNNTSLEGNNTMNKTILIQEERGEGGEYYTCTMLDCHLSCGQMDTLYNSVCRSNEMSCDEPYEAARKSYLSLAPQSS